MPTQSRKTSPSESPGSVCVLGSDGIQEAGGLEEERRTSHREREAFAALPPLPPRPPPGPCTPPLGPPFLCAVPGPTHTPPQRIFNTFGPRMHPNDGRVVSNFITQVPHSTARSTPPPRTQPTGTVRGQCTPFLVAAPPKGCPLHSLATGPKETREPLGDPLGAWAVLKPFESVSCCSGGAFPACLSPDPVLGGPVCSPAGRRPSPVPSTLGSTTALPGPR